VEDPVEEHRRPAATTIAAAAGMIAVTVPFVVDGIGLLSLASNPDAADADLKRDIIILGTGSGAGQVANYARIVGGIFLLISAICWLLAFGVLRRKQGALNAAVGVFGLLAIVTIVLAVTGLDSAPNAGFALILGIVEVAVVFLLTRRSTISDVERKEMVRARLKADRDQTRRAERAARRAG
jgi:hypothetical protein